MVREPQMLKLNLPYTQRRSILINHYPKVLSLLFSGSQITKSFKGTIRQISLSKKQRKRPFIELDLCCGVQKSHLKQAISK